MTQKLAPPRKKPLAEKFLTLVEPIFRRQPTETDKEYTLYLIYRDQPWHERSLKKTTAVATNVHENLVTAPHRAVLEASNKWLWNLRVQAYDLYIQENCSEREEKIRIQTKSEIEKIVFRLVLKIKKIEGITNATDLTDPEIVRDIAVLETMLDKGKIGSFLLDAYKTIVGQKVQLGATLRNLPELQWKTAA